jgi:hypothetical protein
MKSQLKIFLIMLVVSFGYGCGNNKASNYVNNVILETKLQDGDIYLNMGAIFTTGQFFMNSITLNILDPDDSSVQFGQFRMLSTLNKKLEVGVNINLSNSAQVKGGTNALLPNGNPLPIGGLNDVEILELKINQSNGKIYLGLDADAVLFGFAIPIKEFSQLSRSIGVVDIFPGFVINKVSGMFGIFTGREENSSGIAFFVDLSGVITPTMLNRLLDGLPYFEEDKIVMNAQAESGKTKSRLDFSKGIKVGTRKLYKANQVLKGIEKNSPTLHVAP